jgi:hypothetical protein
MPPLRIISAKTEEKPHYFNITKGHIVGAQIGGPHPGYPELKYDPFPNAQVDDIVRTEIIGRKLILTAQLRGPSDSQLMGHAIEYQGHKFAVKNLVKHFDGPPDDRLFEVEGEAFTVLIEPVEAIKRTMRMLAADNPQ